MPKIAFAQLLCCFVLILDVGDTKGESSAEVGTDASEKQQLLVIIKEQEEEIAAMATNYASNNAAMATNYAAMAKNSLKEREELRKQTAKEQERLLEQMEKEREEFRQEIRRVRENKDSKINKKTKRQFNELQECKSREAKRLKDAVNPKSANGSLHRNSSRMDADGCASSQLRKPFIKPAKTTAPILQLFVIPKTYSQSRHFCQSLGGDLATFPDTKHLVRAFYQAGSGDPWIGGRCEGASGECHRSEQKKQWKWIGGGEISYDLTYWYRSQSEKEPAQFTEPGCLQLGGSFLYAFGCETSKFNFLCQF